MQRKVYLDFQDGSGFRDVSSYVKYDTLAITIRGCSDTFHYAQNEASFDLVYNSTIYTLLRNATKFIICKITDDAGTPTPLFYGRISPTQTREYNGILNNTIWNISADDGLQQLDIPIGDICYTNFVVMEPMSPVTSIVHQLAYLAGFTEAQIGNVTIVNPIVKFAPNSENDSILDVLDTLLHEYGYILHRDESGKITPIKWINNAATTYDFTNSNILRTVAVDDPVKEYGGVKLIWYEVSQAVTTSGNKDILLYRDDNCGYNDDGTFAGYYVPSGVLYPPACNVIDTVTSGNSIVYQEYDDNAVAYWTNYAVANKLDYNYNAFTSDFSGIVATSGWWVDASYDSGLTRTVTQFGNKKARLVYSNPTSTGKYLYYNNIYGNVWYRSSEKTLTSTVVSGMNLDTYSSLFIYDSVTASGYAQNLASQYAIGARIYTVYSEAYRSIGECVNITMGDGTDQDCLIIERSWNEKESLYVYKCRAHSADKSAITGQTIKSGAKISAQDTLDSYIFPTNLSVKANIDGSSPDLTNAYTDFYVSLGGKNVTADWTYAATVSGVVGSFGTGEHKNRYTVSGFTANDVNHGTVSIVATRTGFTPQAHTYTIDKVYQSDAASSNVPLDPSAYYSMDEVPEIPDNPSGTVYRNDAAWTGWPTTVSSAAVLSVTGGVLIQDITGSDPWFTREMSYLGSAGRYVYLRIRQTAGAPINDVTFYWATTTRPSFSGSYCDVKNVALSSSWQTVVFDLANPTYGGNEHPSSAITRIMLQVPDTGASGQRVELSALYIGTGAYLPGSVLDNSGHGNHGTIYGCTPVAGVSGKALEFDGVNSYIDIGAKDGLLKTSHTYSAWFKWGQQEAGTNDDLSLILGITGYHRGLLIDRASKRIAIIVATDEYKWWQINGPTITDSNFHHACGVVDDTTKFIYLYLDGTLIGSKSYTGSLYQDPNDALRIGGALPTGSFQYKFKGVIDEPMLFSRALTAPEVLGLYLAKTLQKTYTNADLVTGINSNKLILSSSGVTRNRASAVTPTTLTASAQDYAGLAYAGRFVIDATADNVNYYNQYTSSANETSHAYTIPATINISGTDYYVTAFRVRLYAAGGTTFLSREQTVYVALDSSTTPVYFGVRTTAPTSGMLANDYYFDGNTSGSGGGVIRYYTGSAWALATSSWAFYTTAWNTVMSDAVTWCTTYGTTIAAVTAFISNLVANNAFISQLSTSNQYSNAKCDDTVTPRMEIDWDNALMSLRDAPQLSDMEVSDGYVKAYKGQGVQRRYAKLSQESLDWVDAPDTTPASSELLRARIGRLGVGGSILLDGDFNASIVSEFGQEISLNSTNSYCPDYVEMPDGTIRMIWMLNSTGYLYERIYSNSSWSSDTLIVSKTAFPPKYLLTSSGQLYLFYNYNGSIYYISYISGSWDLTEHFVTTTAWPTGSRWFDVIEYNNLIRVAYRDPTTAYLTEKIYSGSVWNGGSPLTNHDIWSPVYADCGSELKILYLGAGSSNVYEIYMISGVWSSEYSVSGISASFYVNSLKMLNGDVWVYSFTPSNTLVRKIYSRSSWGSAETILSGVFNTPGMIQTRDSVIRLAYQNASSYLSERILYQYCPIGSGIIERGSNSNGSYIKFGDGTLVCWGWGFMPWPSGSSISETVTFPYAFIDTNYYVNVSVAGYKTTDPASLADTADVSNAWASFRILTSATMTVILTYTTAVTSGHRCLYSWKSIGRWK